MSHYCFRGRIAVVFGWCRSSVHPEHDPHLATKRVMSPFDGCSGTDIVYNCFREIKIAQLAACTPNAASLSVLSLVLLLQFRGHIH